jgi:hypothetical protein
VAVIELDLDAPPAPPTPRPPARWFRLGGLVLAVVLALTAGAAAPVTSILWQRLGLVPLGAADTTFALVDGRVHTLEPAADGTWRTSVWAGRPLRRAWTATTGVARDESQGAGYGGVNLTATGGHLLVQDPVSTTVVDARSGAVRWSASGPLTDLGAGLGVTVETAFRPGSEYDVAGGAPGDLFFSPTGQPYTEPPRRTTLHGVDLATGRRLWSSEQRGAVRIARAPGDAPAVVVVGADRAAVLAADTGTVLRSTSLPRDGDVAWVDFVGDLLLIRGGRMTESGPLSAYGMDTLALRWRTVDPPDRGAPGFCFDIICSNSPSGRTVLDPGSGRPAWHVAPDVTVVRRGGSAVETGAFAERSVQVRDVVTGAVLARLTSWDTAVNSDRDGPLVMRRAETDRGVTAFGALLPGDSTVRPLGVSGELVDDCVADDRHVACRTSRGLEVWSYRA